VRCDGTFYASDGEKIHKDMSFLSARTCVHQPIPVSRTSGMLILTHSNWQTFELDDDGTCKICGKVEGDHIGEDQFCPVL